MVWGCSRVFRQPHTHGVAYEVLLIAYFSQTLACELARVAKHRLCHSIAGVAKARRDLLNEVRGESSSLG